MSFLIENQQNNVDTCPELTQSLTQGSYGLLQAQLFFGGGLRQQNETNKRAKRERGRRPLGVFLHPASTSKCRMIRDFALSAAGTFPAAWRSLSQATPKGQEKHFAGVPLRKPGETAPQKRNSFMHQVDSLDLNPSSTSPESR